MTKISRPGTRDTRQGDPGSARPQPGVENPVAAQLDVSIDRAAGGLGVALANAATLVHQTSRGYPRAVNNLALQALVAPFAADKAIVDESSTRAAIAEVTAD
jgi:type II secretory pathway predicted ATPase ExeA